MIEFYCKHTNDITDQEIASIYDLFKEVFNKTRSVEGFKEQFTNTSLGYSYHSIAKEGNKVVGHNVYIPFKYYKNDVPFLVCLSVDAMIHPDFRGNGLYRKLLLFCEEMAIADGCKIRIGFPNDNSYPIQINGFKYNDVGRLYTYCLPIRIGDFNHKLKLFNPISKVFATSLIILSNLSKNTNLHKYLYRKDSKDFDRFRYKWFGGSYQHIDSKEVFITYKDSEFKGQNATFIMDVYPMNKRNFDLAVREVYKRVKKYSPFIIYVGNLHFSPISMIRIPAKLEPKHFHFVTKILDSDFIGPESLDINNWELNLSNYDLL